MAPTVPLTKAQIETHNRLLLDLLAMREKLMGVDPQTLDVGRHDEWNEQVYEISLAIAAAQQAIHLSVSAAYARRLSKMQLVIEKLNSSAVHLDKADDVIAVVGADLGTITSVVKLLT